MKKLFIGISLILVLGCTSAEKVGDNIIQEKKEIVIIANTEDGFIFKELGKFYYVEEINGEVTEININDLATYMAKATVGGK